jgi:hypothetical protein
MSAVSDTNWSAADGLKLAGSAGLIGATFLLLQRRES